MAKFMSLDSNGNINISKEFVEILEAWDDTVEIDENTEYDLDVSWGEDESCAIFFNDIFNTENIWVDVDRAYVGSDLNIYTKELIEDNNLTTEMKIDMEGKIHIKGICTENSA